MMFIVMAVRYCVTTCVAQELMAPVVYPKQYGLAQLGRVFEAFQKREVYGKAVLHVAPKAAL